MNAEIGDASPLSILLVEDSFADATLVRVALASSLVPRFELTHTVRLDDALEALSSGSYDAVLLDLGLPDSQGLASFTLLHGRFRFAPVVILTGTRDDSTALGAVRLGAQDYLVKGRYDPDVLSRVIRHAIERQRLMQQLEQSLAYVRTLLHATGVAPNVEDGAGVLTMCAWCKQIRDTSGRWQTIEDYLNTRTAATISHGACPTCALQLRREGRIEESS